MIVLLEFHNEYDQHGGYFAGVFNSVEDIPFELGRKDFDYIWFEYYEVEIGKSYDPEDIENHIELRG